jgi:hypothetical protein
VTGTAHGLLPQLGAYDNRWMKNSGELKPRPAQKLESARRNNYSSRGAQGFILKRVQISPILIQFSELSKV